MTILVPLILSAALLSRVTWALKASKTIKKRLKFSFVCFLFLYNSKYQRFYFFYNDNQNTGIERFFIASILHKNYLSTDHVYDRNVVHP